MVDTSSILRRLQVPQKEEEAEIWETNRWLNRDNVPLPPHRRSWGFWSYTAFWVTSGVNVSSWAGGASFLGLGLTIGQTMIVSIIGHILVSIVIVLTGQLGAYWHVGFPMWNRMTWGMRASYFPLVNRIILSFTWAATQGWFGGQCLKVVLGAMAPGIYTMKNHMPVSTGMTSADFMCFMIITLITIPLLMIPPEYLRRPLIVSACASTLTCFVLFIWSLARGHGGGPLLTPKGFEVVKVAPAKGTALAWAIVRGISASLGGVCAGLLNQSDYTRFAVRPRHPFVSQAIFSPITGVLSTLIGIVCASVGSIYYPGVLLWTPYKLLTAIQLHGGPGARAAVFFAGLAFTCAQLSLNVSGNLVAGGIDLASLAPKYINIRRGSYMTLAVSLAMCPWALLSGATAFITVMSGYAVFLAPVTGIMVFDYFFVRHRKVKLSALYDGSPTSIYWYWKGVNLRTVTAWACGVGPMFPGFLQSVTPKTVTIPLSMTHLYFLCYPVGFLLSGVIHVALSKIFPVAGVGEVDEYDIFGTFGEPETAPEQTHKIDGEHEHHGEKDMEANVTLATIMDRGA